MGEGLGGVLEGKGGGTGEGGRGTGEAGKGEREGGGLISRERLEDAKNFFRVTHGGGPCSRGEVSCP